MMKKIHCRSLAALMLALTVMACAALADGQGFRAEYEALNGQPVPDGGGQVYMTLSLEEPPRGIRLTAQEASELSEDGAVVFMGAPWCPWCRNALPSLMQAARDEGYGYFYYVDLTDERDSFTIRGGKPVMTEEGTPGYRALLSGLEAFLPDYTLPGPDGMPVSVGEKRVYLPTLAYLTRDGFMSAMQPMCTPEEGKTAYDPLTEEQRAGLTERIVQWLRDCAGVGEAPAEPAA